MKIHYQFVKNFKSKLYSMTFKLFVCMICRPRDLWFKREKKPLYNNCMFAHKVKFSLQKWRNLDRRAFFLSSFSSHLHMLGRLREAIHRIMNIYWQTVIDSPITPSRHHLHSLLLSLPLSQDQTPCSTTVCRRLWSPSEAVLLQNKPRRERES